MVLSLIIMEIGKMENGMGQVYFFKKRELKIKDNVKMIRSMEEVKQNLKMEMLLLDNGNSKKEINIYIRMNSYLKYQMIF